MPSMLIKGGRVWDGERFFAADVLVTDGVIDRIEKNINIAADYTLSAKGKTVSAGLIDIHTHFRHLDSIKYSANIDAVSLPFGVTAAVDAAAEEGDADCLRLFAVKSLVFAKCPVKDDTADIKKAAQTVKAFGDKCIGVKIFFDTAGSEVKSIKPLKEVCAFAGEHNLSVAVHSNRSPVSMEEIVDVLRKGDILTHAYHGGANDIAENGYAAYHKAKQKGIIIDTAMAGNSHIDYKVFEDAVKAGFMPDTLSTDITKGNAFKRGGRYGLLMCMSMARAMGLSEEDTFRAVTSGAAKAVGMGNVWGRLKPGAAADIAVLDYTREGFDITDKFDHRLKSRKGYRCALTLINGEVAYRDV